MTHTINTNNLKALIPYCPNRIKNFVRLAARVHGKLALREQLNYETENHDFSSIKMVNLDRAELKREIIHEATLCASALRALNHIAESHNLPLPSKNLEEINLTEFLNLIDTYVTELVAASDYAKWSEAYELVG